MLKRVFIMSAIAALAFSGAAQTVMATKKYVDSVKTEVLSNLSSFAFFDGTMNNRRVSSVRGIGGFQFKDLNGDDEEFGMEFRPYNDYTWAFSIWDKTAYPSSGRGNPIFALGWNGLRVPTDISGENLYTIPWRDLVRASGISDSVVDDSHNWKENPVNSIAVRYFVNRAVPRMIGDAFATGTVNSAYTLDTATKGKVIYEDMVLDAAWLGATSTVYTAVSTNYTAWTDPFVAETDGCALHELSWIDGTWALWIVMVEPGHEGDVFMVGTQTGPENALSLNFSFGGHEYTFNRSIASIDAYPGNNAFGYVTDETVTNVVRGIVTNMLADSISESTITNVVRKVVHATGRYVWDKDLSVCYRFNAQNGFLDLVAVTNIDVTLPQNYLALEAIEKEWSNK